MRRIILALLAATPVFAQLPSNSITVTATRSLVLQPDQALLNLTVSSGLSTTADQAAAALASLGITSANLTGVQNPSPTTLQWNFSLAAPISSLGMTLASLVQLEHSIGQNNSGLALSFYVTGTQISPQLQQSQQSQSCADSELIADATAQGQKLATAAGVTLGAILRLSNGAISQPILFAQLNAFPIPAGDRSGSFSDFLLRPSLPSTCSLTVVFQLQP